MNLGVKDKNIWDWAELLFVPLVLLIGGAWLTNYQSEKQNNIELVRITQQNLIEHQRNNINILNNYRRSITDLMLNGLLESGGDSKVKLAAQALTISTLPQLDGERKGQLIIFLYTAKLIIGNEPDIALNLVDLSGAKLNGVFLQGANFRFSNLRDVDFRDARLKDVQFIDSDIARADFRGAFFVDSNWVSQMFLTHQPSWREENEIIGKFWQSRGWEVALFDDEVKKVIVTKHDTYRANQDNAYITVEEELQSIQPK